MFKASLSAHYSSSLSLSFLLTPHLLHWPAHAAILPRRTCASCHEIGGIGWVSKLALFSRKEERSF